VDDVIAWEVDSRGVVEASVDEEIAPSVVELASAPAEVEDAGVVAWSEHTPATQFRSVAHFPSLLAQDPPRAMGSIYWQYQSEGVVEDAPGSW